VRSALAAPNATRRTIVAAVVRLIDRALLRPGYEEYARNEGGRGAATLLGRDVSIEGDRVTLDFKGKGGKKIKQEVRDPLLARIARRVPSLAATSTNCPKRANSYGSDATHRPEKVGSQRKFADSSLKLNQLRLNRR
jgi:DNA topoisomerase IB